MCRCERQRTCVPRGNTPICRDTWCVRATYQDRVTHTETDAFFDNVCELDLVFNFYKVRLYFLTGRADGLSRYGSQVYAILDEIFLAGEIEETSKDVVLSRLETLEKLE